MAFSSNIAILSRYAFSADTGPFLGTHIWVQVKRKKKKDKSRGRSERKDKKEKEKENLSRD